MTVESGLLVTLEAKPGRADDLSAFLAASRDIDEAGRQAHLDGQIPVALGQAGPDLLTRDPVIQPIDLVAVK